LNAGATQLRPIWVAKVLVGTFCKPVGSSGICAARMLTSSEKPLSPTKFLASTTKVYVIPGARPTTVVDVAI